MTETLEILSQCPLFAGIETAEMGEMLACLNGREVAFSKGSPVFLEGDPVQLMGVVLTGSVQILREDYYGDRSVLTQIGPGELFAEVFACAGLENMPVSVIAVKPSRVLLLDCRRVLTTCAHTCRFHSRLVQNLLQGIAQKNLALNRKISCMAPKTTREKLMVYLLEQAKAQGSAEFTIPFDRQSLADYLGVERSAMSAELSKLKKDGVIDTHGAWFRVYSEKT